MEKMYNDNNRPSKTELEDMKEKLLIELENCYNPTSSFYGIAKPKREADIDEVVPMGI